MEILENVEFMSADVCNLFVWVCLCERMIASNNCQTTNISFKGSIFFLRTSLLYLLGQLSES